MSAAISPT